MSQSRDNDEKRLLLAIAQQVKNPMLHVARLAELANESQHLTDVKRALSSIETSAEAAIQLIESFIYSSQLNSGQQQLHMEPVAVSTVLDEVASRLDRSAKQHDCTLKLSVGQNCRPVIADKKALTEALTSLGLVCMEGQPREEGHASVLMLAAHQSTRTDKVVAGVFGLQKTATQAMLRRGRRLFGSAAHPMPSLAVGSGGGIFVAENIFSLMDVDGLHIAWHRKLAGLAASLPPSSQMHLV